MYTQRTRGEFSICYRVELMYTERTSAIVEYLLQSEVDVHAKDKGL